MIKVSKWIIEKLANNEVLIQSTTDRAINQEVSLSIKPELIHIMKREFSTNRYSDAYINKNNQVVFAETAWDCDVTQILPGSSLNEEGYLVSKDGRKYDLSDFDVIADVDMWDIEISDDLEEGNVVGEIIQMVWKGDHYQLIIRTEDEEDFVVDTVWTWNEFDKVSVKIDPKKIKLKAKADLSKYEI